MRRPKWSLNSVQEERTVSLGTVERLILSLEDFPSDAEVYADCYDLRVAWMRDMTDIEYEKERRKRRKRKEAQQQRDRAKLEQLAKKLGAEVKI